jgi:predicted  nucleic acid-binding Zn-ribbon protein
MRSSGKYKEDGGRDNALTRAIAEKQKKDAQISGLGLDAKAIEAGEKELADIAEAAKTADVETAALEKRIESLKSEMASLSASAPAAKSLDDIKKKMAELGVTGLDDVKTVQDLRNRLKQLEGVELDKLQTEIDTVGDIVNETGKDVQKMGDQIRASTDEIKAQDEAAANQSAFESRIKQFLGLTGAVELLRRSMMSAFNTIKELDAAMTEMAVVTDIDISGYWDQLPEYTARANELGLTIKDVYEADTLFYQ